MVVLITLTTAGIDAGPFDLYSNVDGYTTAFETGVSKSALVAGYTSNLVPNSTITVRVRSTGVCTNFIDIPIGGITTTTSSTTIAPSNICYELQNEFNVSGECFDCPGTYLSQNTTFIRFLSGCEGSVISPPSNMTVLVTYSDESTETVIINSGTPAGYVSVGGSETLCGSPPSCIETSTPTVVAVHVTSESTGNVPNCCSVPVQATSVYGFMAACIGGTINDHMGADIILSGPVSISTDVMVDVTYSLNGNCSGQTFVQSIGVTIPAGGDQSTFDACQSGSYFQNGATICSACVSSCDNPLVDITLVDC
jgi:hypothetical protein